MEYTFSGFSKIEISTPATTDAFFLSFPKVALHFHSEFSDLQ